MASRVNVKFLVILSVGLLLTAGLVGGLGAMVLLKSPEDNIRRGDQLTAEGKYRDAMREYGKAVSKEQQNVRYLEILLEAAQRYIPETDAEYFAQYRDLYIGVIRQLAVAQPHDLEAQQRFLDALLEQYQRSGAGSEAWQGFMDHARSRIADFSGPEEERQRSVAGLHGPRAQPHRRFQRPGRRARDAAAVHRAGWRLPHAVRGGRQRGRASGDAHGAGRGR